MSCLFEAALHGMASTDGCWVGGSTTAHIEAPSRPTDHLKLPPATIADNTFLDRDWQQHRKLYESHNSLKLVADELNTILRFASKRLPPGWTGVKDVKGALASAEEAVNQLRKENTLLLAGKRTAN